LTSHCIIPYHTYHFSHFTHLHLLIFLDFGCTDPTRDCTYFHGKKGMKDQRECSWKNTKEKTITIHMLAQRGLKNNETFLLKNQRPTTSKYTYIKMSHLPRDLHKCVTSFCLPLWHYVYLSLQVTLWYYPPSFMLPIWSTHSFWNLIN
jgi:hypothetical protein